MERRRINFSITEAAGFGFFMLLCVFLFGCQQEEKLTARQIVERSVEAHGGLENWNTIKQLSFDKVTTLFNEDGSVASKTEQFQMFRMQPELFGKIEWESNGTDLSIIYEDDKIETYIKDSLVTNRDELQKAKNRFFAAQYVISQPYELLNDDVELIIEGIQKLEEYKVYKIRVKYKGDIETSNKWFYFINTKTYEVIANKVELLDHTSWVENLTFDTTSDFKFNAHRKSYRLNDAGEKTYLRAEYVYKDYSVTYK